jgi:hypothetical protein
MTRRSSGFQVRRYVGILLLQIIRNSANGANGMSDIEGSEPDWCSCEGSSE